MRSIDMLDDCSVSRNGKQIRGVDIYVRFLRYGNPDQCPKRRAAAICGLNEVTISEMLSLL